MKTSVNTALNTTKEDKKEELKVKNNYENLDGNDITTKPNNDEANANNVESDMTDITKIDDENTTEGKNDSKKSNNKATDSDKKEKRKHKKYKVSINHTELKALEGTTISGFLDLATAVILIDGKPYDKNKITLSKERKNDFKRYVEHYAVLDTIGKRKYHIKRVYSPEQREELNEQESNIKRDSTKK